MGITRALRGTIWTAMIITMNAVRPLKPNRATETAARNASAIEMMTTVRTTTRLLTTSFQKKGTFIAVRKLSNVEGGGRGRRGGGGREDFPSGFERGRDHPVDREHHQGEDDDAGAVEERPG